MSAHLNPAQATMYRHSGRVPVGGLALALAILIPIAVVAGVLYSGAVVFLPFIKLRGLLSFAYGGGIGAVVGVVCKYAKFRNRFMVALTTLIITAVSYYAAWAVHCAWVVMSQQGFSGDVVMTAVLGFLPQAMFEWGRFIFENGIWIQNGNPTDGWEAVAGWVIEAAIVFSTAFVARKTYGTAPFCEDCDVWTEETKQLADLPVLPSDPAWQQVASGQIAAIRKLQLAQDTPQYVELQLASCPSCTISNFLSAVGVTMALNKAGEIQKQEADIFRGMQISNEQKDEILDFAGELAEAVQIMNEEASGPVAEPPPQP